MHLKMLAGFRFLLAWFIVCDHLAPFIVNPNKDFLYKLKVFTPLGEVIALLLISGYLIGNSITKKNEEFYNRRLIRIYPLYFLGVILSLLPFLIFGSTVEVLNGDPSVQPETGSVIGYLMFLQGFVVGPLSSNNPLWPMSILAFAYLFTPFFNRLSSKVLLMIAGASASLYVILPNLYVKVYGEALPYYSYMRYGLPFYLFIWVWILGFIYFREQDKTWAKALLIGSSLLLILSKNRTGLVAVAVYLVTCFLLILSPHIKIPRFLSSILNYLGDIAFPFYLFHKTTFILTYSLLGIKNSITHMFLAVLVGMLFYHAVDLPLRSRKIVA